MWEYLVNRFLVTQYRQLIPAASCYQLSMFLSALQFMRAQTLLCVYTTMHLDGGGAGG